MGRTSIFIGTIVAHEPVVGVKVYVVVAVLFKVGDQLPAMLLLEIVGSAGIISPEQIGAIGVKVGVLFGLTIMVILAVVAQTPDVGVNV